MKVYVVRCMHAGYPDYANSDCYKGYLCGVYSNLAFAARAAIKSIETDFHKPFRIRCIFSFNNQVTYYCHNNKIFKEDILYCIESKNLNEL